MSQLRDNTDDYYKFGNVRVNLTCRRPVSDGLQSGVWSQTCHIPVTPYLGLDVVMSFYRLYFP